MTAPAIRPALWSGHEWIDRFRPGDAWLTGRPYLAVKRAFDLVVVTAAAPLWLPLMALAALLVKLDDPRAPVFFSHFPPHLAAFLVAVQLHRQLSARLDLLLLKGPRVGEGMLE